MNESDFARARVEHQNTPRSAKVDRVARIAADGSGESRIMAQMALDEFVAKYWEGR